MRITISGPIGSGKTTICNLLSARLDLPCVVSGHIFREMAKEQGLTLAEFGRLAESDPRFDRMLDERMVQIARDNEDIIIEGRLAAQMLTRRCIPAYRIFLDAPLEVRVRRVMNRESKAAEQAEKELLEREESEAVRYRHYYGIDIRDKSVYDLIVDTGPLTPEQIVERILERMRDATADKRSVP